MKVVNPDCGATQSTCPSVFSIRNDGSVVMGSPGRVVRQVTGKDREIMTGPARRYVERMARYRRELRPEER